MSVQHRHPSSGVLQLALKQIGGRTVLYDSYAQAPLRVLRPLYLDDSGTAYLYLLNPSGGVLGGDSYTIEIILDPNAQALVTTPSATKLYAVLDEPACQRIRATIHDGAIFTYLPEQTIPFAHSAFHQHMCIQLGDGAYAFIGDILAPGRLARDEVFAYREYVSSLRVEQLNGEVLLLDRFCLHPQQQPLNQLGLLEDYPYLGTFYALSGNQTLDPAIAETLHNQWKDDTALIGSATTLPHGGLAVRLLAKDHHHISQALYNTWNVLRQQLFGYPAAAPRT